MSGSGGRNLAGAIVLRQFSHEKISLARGVLFLFSGYFNALSDLDGGRISNEVVVLPIAFIAKNNGIRGGGDATVERLGLSRFGKQEKRGREQKSGETMRQR